jgi:mono/diheme cytochrome c family protein
MTSRLAGFVFAALSLVLATDAWTQTAPSNSAQPGRELTQATCGACHVVAQDAQEKPVLNPPAPSLLAVARRPAYSADALRRRLAYGHGQSSPKGAPPHPRLNDEQIEQVVSYISSLRPAE